MFTVNDARCTNQLETANKQRIEQMLFHQNGFTRNSLSATVTRVSNFVEESSVCGVLLHRQGPHLGGFSHLMPNTTGEICQSQSTQHVQIIE